MSTPNGGSGTSTPSRFTSQTSQTATVADLLSSQTAGLVNLDDYRKRRAEAVEQKERDSSGFATPASVSGTSTPVESEAKAKPKKKRKIGKAILSFGVEEEEDSSSVPTIKPQAKVIANGTTDREGSPPKKAKFAPNASVGIIPKSLTKRTLLQETAEREKLRKDFLAIQQRVKATPVAIPFVFYDGSNISGGTVRVLKGDYVWKFLDSSRKVGAEVGAGQGASVDVAGEKERSDARARREWAKVGVDDLIMVRGEIIVPPHYDFYHFIVNKTLGPKRTRLFDYSTEPPANSEASIDEEKDGEIPADFNPLSRPGTKLKPKTKQAIPIHELEGANDDPGFTKVVDRRWYEKNKHIYPASVWQEFDPTKDYQKEVKRDAGGNAFFFS